MPPSQKQNTIRVGVLITVSLAVLMIFLFFIGSESKIWARKNEYEVRFDSVAGLAQGNPVKISGVTVGAVRDITLPRDPKKRDVEISLMVDRKYAELIRGDSRARLKKLGLLAGDNYIDITPGNPKFPSLDPGSIIPAQKETNYEQLLSSGEDLVSNFVEISYSLKNILARVDRGEGLIGELTTAPATKQRLTDTILTTLNKTNAAFEHMESGRGLAGKLIYDDKYANQLSTSLLSTASSLQSISGNVQHSIESGNGALPALLSDPQGKQKVFELVDNLRLASANLAAFSNSMKTGEGLVPRLINDKAYGDQALGEFTNLVHQLNDTVGKINSGQGTAGKMISDPSVYESINDILIGINESKLLRWLIRNRQQNGIEKRYNEERKTPNTSLPAPPAGGDGAPQPVVTSTATTTTSVTTTTETSSPATTTAPVPPPY